MARHIVFYQFIFSNILLLHIFVQLKPGCVASSYLSSPVTECMQYQQYSKPEPLIICDLQCPPDCTCSLGNFSEVVVNCASRNVSVLHIVYPDNVTYLSWAYNDLSGIGKDSFSGFTGLLELDLWHNMLTDIYILEHLTN